MKQPFHLFLIVSTVLSILIYSQYSDQEEGKIASNPSSLSTPKPSLHFLKSTSTRNLASSEKTEVYYFKRELSADLIQAVGSIEKPIFKMQYDGFFFIKELSENNFQTTIHFSENTLKQFPEEMKTANNLIPPFANFECDSNGKITSLKLKKNKRCGFLKIGNPRFL